MYDDHSDERPVRILIFDIETTPTIGYTWAKWQQNVLDFVEPSHLLCFAYRWYGEDDIHVVSQRQFARSYKRNRKDDRQVVQKLWDLFDEADIIVAHNGDRFDITKVQGRFAVHGMQKPSPFYTVDTKKVAARQWRLHSNSLNDLGKQLGLGVKLQHTGFSLWLGCMAGEDDSWQLMEDYNRQDVELLTELYHMMLTNGWIYNHPPVNSISGNQHACPTCGETDGSQFVRRGYKTTGAYTYVQYRCSTCGHYHRSPFSVEGSRTTRRSSTR